MIFIETRRDNYLFIYELLLKCVYLFFFVSDNKISSKRLFALIIYYGWLFVASRINLVFLDSQFLEICPTFLHT